MAGTTAKVHKSPTMKDVAQLIGVSAQTVSAVINGKPGITQETQDRVFAAIDQLGYRPYSVARSLRTRRTNTIALIVPDINNPSFSAIASTAEDYAHQFGYSLVVYNTHDDVQREASYIRTVSERWVDGVLFVAARDQMTSLDRLQSVGIPSVAIDRIPEHYAGPAVTLDNVGAGRIATDYLISLGHCHIAHISGPLHLHLARERRLGYLKSLEAHGLLSGLIFPSSGWTCADGDQVVRAMLESNPMPTAIFCANDRMAIGVIHVLRQRGIRVPEDISIVGLDDIEVATFLDPPLTTIRQSFADLATRAVKTLLSILKGEWPDPAQVALEPVLVVRQSTTRLEGPST